MTTCTGPRECNLRTEESFEERSGGKIVPGRQAAQRRGLCGADRRSKSDGQKGTFSVLLCRAARQRRSFRWTPKVARVRHRGAGHGPRDGGVMGVYRDAARSCGIRYLSGLGGARRIVCGVVSCGRLTRPRSRFAAIASLFVLAARFFGVRERRARPRSRTRIGRPLNLVLPRHRCALACLRMTGWGMGSEPARWSVEAARRRWANNTEVHPS